MKDKKESCLDVLPRVEESSWRGSRKTDFASDADENGSQDPSSELNKMNRFVLALARSCPLEMLYLPFIYSWYGVRATF